MSLKSRVAFNLILHFTLALSISAETIYVDALHGVDEVVNRDGKSLPQAFRTIEFASAQVVAGDTVVVMPGHYSRIDWKDGVTYKGQGRAVITQQDLTSNNHDGTVVDGFEFRLGVPAFVRGRNLTIRNSKFLNGSGLNGPNFFDTRVEKCLFQGLTYGFATNGNRNIVDRSTFIDTTITAVALAGAAKLNRVTNSIFYGNNTAISGGPSTLHNSVEFSAFFGNETDKTGHFSVLDNNNFIESPRTPGGSNKPAVDPNFLDPSAGLYFLRATSTDGVSPNPLINGGSFLPQENRISHIGAFGVGIISERDALQPEANDFSNWTVQEGEPDSGVEFQQITGNPDPELPVEFDAEDNLRLKDSAVAATLRSNIMDLQAALSFVDFEVIGVHYVSTEDQASLPAGFRRVIDHNKVDDGTGGVQADRRRTIRFRGSAVSADDVLNQPFVEISNMERLNNLGFGFVQLEVVLRRDGR